MREVRMCVMWHIVVNLILICYEFVYLRRKQEESYLLTLTERGKSLFQKVESQYFKIISNKRNKLMNVCTKYKNKVDRPRKA